MTSRFQYPHIRIELVLPINGDEVKKHAITQVEDLKEVLDSVISRQTPKGKMRREK